MMTSEVEVRKDDDGFARTESVPPGTKGRRPRAWAVHREFGATGLSERDFFRLSDLIRERFGINIKAAKQIMLEARLRRRLRRLGIPTFDAYCDYLFSKEGMEQELTPMIDEVTTNKTDFFREPVHFEHLTRMVLPELWERAGVGKRRCCAVWSAGCSSGEEPYTLAMVLTEFAAGHAPFSFRIYASDVSTKVLEKAAAAIYTEEKVATVPMEYRKKYLMRSKDPQREVVRIVPELRSSVSFLRVNFFDDALRMPESMDVVFCRNVIIYFDRTNQLRVLQRICDHMRAGGYLFMGHSETLHGMDLPLEQVAPTVYRRMP